MNQSFVYLILVNAEQINTDILNTNKMTISQHTNIDKLYHIWIHCMNHIMLNNEHFIDEMLNNKIVTKLVDFAEPCRDNEFLEDLSKMYCYLLTHNVDEWMDDTQKIIILYQLNILLPYQDNDKILNNILDAYNGLIKQCDNDEDINIIIDNDHATSIKKKYAFKQQRNETLFNGFIHETTIHSNIDYVPNDLYLLIFEYYNCYKNVETDLIQRLINLINKDNGYSIRIRNAAIYTLSHIAQYYYEEILNKLVYQYNLLDHFKTLFSDFDESIDWNNIYWILSNFSNDHMEYVWDYNIFKLMVEVFNIQSLDNCLIAAQMICPLLSMVEQEMLNADKLNVIIMEYKLIDGVCILMKNVLEYENCSVESYFDVEEIFHGLFDLIEYLSLLQYDNFGDICIAKIKEHNGVLILNQIRNDETTLEIGDDLKQRAIDILADYFNDSQ